MILTYVFGVAVIINLLWKLFDDIIFPKIIRTGMKEVERNPKWITSQLEYYGFSDIDFVLCESRWGMLPHFKASKDNTRLELWIDNDTTTREVEDIGRLALSVKIKIQYGVWFPDKPIYWLSILLYMLDGGDIVSQMQKVKKQETS